MKTSNLLSILDVKRKSEYPSKNCENCGSVIVCNEVFLEINIHCNYVNFDLCLDCLTKTVKKATKMLRDE